MGRRLTPGRAGAAAVRDGLAVAALPLLSRWQVENEAEHLANLGQRRSADVAERDVQAAGCDGADVLALRGRIVEQSVVLVGVDVNLGAEPAPGGGERNDVDDRWRGIEQPCAVSTTAGCRKPASRPIGVPRPAVTTSPEVRIEPDNLGWSGRP